MFNEKEKKLIMQLRKNGREDITKLAKKYQYPKSTLYDLLHRLEHKGVLSHKSFVDFEKAGFPLRMFMIIKTEPTQKLRIRELLHSQKNINSIYAVNHGFHLECIFRNHGEVENLLEELEQIIPSWQITTFDALENIWSERFLTEETHFS